jgi:hypothetical protein
MWLVRPWHLRAEAFAWPPPGGRLIDHRGPPSLRLGGRQLELQVDPSHSTNLTLNWQRARTEACLDPSRAAAWGRRSRPPPGTRRRRANLNAAAASDRERGPGRTRMGPSGSAGQARPCRRPPAPLQVWPGAVGGPGGMIASGPSESARGPGSGRRCGDHRILMFALRQLPLCGSIARND